MIGKINFIRRVVGSSLENEITTGDLKMLDDYKSLDELYGSGDFDHNQTKVEADHNLASSVEGLARLFLREETFINDLKEEVALVKRVLTEFEIKKENQKIIENNVTLKELNFPSPKNFKEGTLVGLYRIQMIYNVPFEKMVEGNISAHPSLPHFQSEHKLQSEDCLHVANLAKSKNNLEKTVEWLQVAEKLAKKENKETSVIEKILEKEIKLHDETALKHGKFILNRKQELEPITTRINLFNKDMAKKNKKKIEKLNKLWRELVEKYPMYKPSDDPETVLYEKLVHEEKISTQCQNIQGSTFLHREEMLKCENLDRSDPYLRLGPHLLERLSEKPSVSLMHGFLTDKQCELLKLFGERKMKSTPLAVPNGKNGHKER